MRIILVLTTAGCVACIFCGAALLAAGVVGGGDAVSFVHVQGGAQEDDARDEVDLYQRIEPRDPMPKERRKRIERRYNMHLVPYFKSSMPLSGTVIAEYELKAENTDDYSIFVLVGYDIFTRAWFKVRSWNSRMLILDPNGIKHTGRCTDPANVQSREMPGFPLDDTAVERYFPSVIARDLYERPEVIRDIEYRTEFDEDLGVPKRTHGIVVTAGLPDGERFGDRRFQNPEDVPKREVRYEVDTSGKILSIERPSGPVEEFTYQHPFPGSFPVAKTANGGNWNLVKAEYYEEGEGPEFTPEAISEFAQSWSDRFAFDGEESQHR